MRTEEYIFTGTENILMELCPKHYDIWNSDRIVEIPIMDDIDIGQDSIFDIALYGTKLKKIEIVDANELLKPGDGAFIPMKYIYEDDTEILGFWCLLVEGKSYQNISKENRKLQDKLLKEYKEKDGVN